MSNAEFIEQVLLFCVEKDIAECLFFHNDTQLCVSVNCNDLFGWACSDCTDITPNNFELFKQSIEDCTKIDDVLGALVGMSLFACRVNKMRPQGAGYPKNKDLWYLFDECGPERKINMGNPYKQGEYDAIRQKRAEN